MNRTIVITVVVTLVLITALIFVGIDSSKAWEQFVTDHKCVVVAKESASTGFAGDKVVVIAGKTTWKCDDGVEYSR